MSEEHHHVEDFLNPEFEHYMKERDIAVLLSTVICSHEIAFPMRDPRDGVGIDYASVSTRGGEPEGIREPPHFVIMSCADGTSAEALVQAWIRIESERLLKSAVCFSHLMENLSERGLVEEPPHPFELLDGFNSRCQTTKVGAEQDLDGEGNTDRDCVGGLTDYTS